MSIGANIKAAREARGMTHLELVFKASDGNRDPQAIAEEFQMIEDGAIDYPLFYYTDIAKALGVTLSSLLDEEPAAKPEVKALPPGDGTPNSHMTYEQAERFIQEAANMQGSDVSIAYRAAARNLHPDTGGSTELFQQLQDAKAIIDGYTAGRP